MRIRSIKMFIIHSIAAHLDGNWITILTQKMTERGYREMYHRERLRDFPIKEDKERRVSDDNMQTEIKRTQKEIASEAVRYSGGSGRLKSLV